MAQKQVANYIGLSADEKKEIFKENLDVRYNELLSSPSGYIKLVTEDIDSDYEYLWSMKGDNFKD